MGMKICNATGNGICIGCNRTPPKINGESRGELCRYTAQNIIDALVAGDNVYYFAAQNKFYRAAPWDDYDAEEIT